MNILVFLILKEPECDTIVIDASSQSTCSLLNFIHV